MQEAETPALRSSLKSSSCTRQLSVCVRLSGAVYCHVRRRRLRFGRCGSIGGAVTVYVQPATKELLSRLPFTLTADQQAVIAEINADLDGTAPAARLIQGDVGSGKTLVAFLACLKVIEGGGQTALMAPTELLARQHADNAAKLLEPLGVRLAF